MSFISERPAKVQRLDPAVLEKGSVLSADGTYGVVYRGTYDGLSVAIKELKDVDKLDMNSLMWREANALVESSHPNVLRVIGIIDHPGRPKTIVSELLDGNIKQYILQSPDLSLHDRLLLAQDLAIGLAWLHNHKPQLIHRDVKPENCFVTSDKVAKIGDLGICWNAGVDEVRFEDRNSIPGSPLYAAPEVLGLVDPTSSDEKCDVYSFALVLWFIMTGKMPYAEYEFGGIDNFREAVIGYGERPKLDLIKHEDIQELLQQCWATDPQDRPHMSHVVQRLDDIITEARVLMIEHARNKWNFWSEQKEIVRHSVAFTSVYNWCDELAQESKFLSPLAKKRVLEAVKLIFGAQSNPSTKRVSFPAFATFFSVFSPPKMIHAVRTLEYFYECIQTPYFFGNMSPESQQASLSTMTKGAFIRYANDPISNTRLTLVQVVPNPNGAGVRSVEKTQINLTADRRLSATVTVYDYRGNVVQPDYIITAPSIQDFMELAVMGRQEASLEAKSPFAPLFKGAVTSGYR